MIRSELPANQLQTNRNGIRLPDPAWTRPAYRGPVRFGFVGGIGPLKRSNLIIEALRDLPRGDYVLTLVDSITIRGWRGMSRRDWPVRGEVRILTGFHLLHSTTSKKITYPSTRPSLPCSWRTETSD